MGTLSPRPDAFGDACRIAQVSLLNCLCAAVPARERVITCEEVYELSVALVAGAAAAAGQA